MDINLFFIRQARFLAGLITIICGSVIFGWLFDIAVLKRSFPDAVGMNPLTALTFIMAAAVIVLSTRTDVNRSRLPQILSFFVLWIGIIKLSSFTFQLPLNIDRILFYGEIKNSDDLSNLKITYITATGLFISGTVLILYTASNLKYPALYQALSILLTLSSLFISFGYIYRIPFLYENIIYLKISVRSVICFLLFSLAILFSKPHVGLMTGVSSKYAGGKLARRFIPIIILTPFLLGYLQLLLKSYYDLSPELAVTVLVLALIIILGTGLFFNIHLLNQHDLLIRSKEEEAKNTSYRLNESFNEISALNEELTSSNERLIVLNEHLEKVNAKVIEQRELIAKQKDEKLNQIIDQTTEIIWSFSFINKEENYISRSAEKLLHINLDYLSGGDFDFWYKTVLNEDRMIIEEALVNLKRYNKAECTFRSFHDPSEVKWMYCRLRNVVDANKNIVKQEGILSDITIVKNAEANLILVNQSLTNFKKAIDGSSIVSRADLKGNIIDVNENFEKISGYSKTELLGQNHYIINSGYHPKSFWVEMWKTVSSGKIWRNHVKNKAKDGSYYWVDTFIMPFKNERGQITEYLSIRNDITRKKIAEEKLQQSQTHLKAIFDFANDYFILLDKDYSVLVYNERQNSLLKEILNINLQPGVSILEFLPIERRKNFEQQLKKAEAGELVRYQSQFTNSGKERWFEITINSVKTTEQQIGGYCITFYDTTHIKNVELELNNQRSLLEKAQETAKLGSWVTDLSVKPPKLTWSVQTLSIYGIKEEEFDGSLDTFFSFIYPDDRIKVVSAVEHAVEQKGSFRLDHRIQLRDGSIKWVFSRGRVVKDDAKGIYQIAGVVQDISDRKHIEEVLKEYNERFEILAKATNDAIWDWDINHNTVLWNHGLQTIFGYTESEVEYSKDWMQRKIHPDDLPVVIQDISVAFQQGNNNWTGTYRFKSSKGEYKYVEDRAYIIYLDNKPVRMIGAKQDITTRVNALAEIEKLSLVASKTDNAIVITNSAYEIEWVNDSFVKIFGYESKEVMGLRPDAFMGPDPDHAVTQKIIAKLDNKEAVAEEIVGYSKQGEKHWFKLHITPVLNDQGIVKNTIAIYLDITETKEYETKITTIARELASLIENANVPIFAVDSEGYINEWNKIAEELTGYSRMELLGKKWTPQFVVREQMNKVDTVFKKVIKEGTSIANLEVAINTKDFTTKKLLMSASPRLNATREINGIIMVAQNITELSDYRDNLERIVDERTRELNQALSNEKSMVELKSKFVSIASHEFRTPLSTITMLAGLIKKYRKNISDEQVEEKLDNILQQVNHMTYLLDDVLTIGKADAGKITINKTTINIVNFVNSIKVEVEQSTGKTHDIQIQKNILNETIITDEKLLRNILINLLTNAIKFSPGRQKVNLIVENDSDMLIVDVIDKGIGIPEQDKENLFEPFYRATNVNAIQGTGLGLSIIKKALDLLDGTININSAPGEGTQVTVTIPTNHE